MNTLPATDEQIAAMEDIANTDLENAVSTFVLPLIARIKLEREQAVRECAEKWNPIETAPKDGTWILGWAATDQSPYRISWGTNHRGALRWCSSAGSFVDSYITHWQPLPTPPLIDRGSK